MTSTELNLGKPIIASKMDNLSTFDLLIVEKSQTILSVVIDTEKLKNEQSMEKWTKSIEASVENEFHANLSDDGSHDLSHFKRVSSLASRFARAENGDELVAFAAGMLHDIVTLPKNDPEAKKSSLFAAARSEEILSGLEFPKDLIQNVCHCVHAHSFSANVEPKTIEAKCVQDADRMEALGAFGLMRTFYCSGLFGSKLLDKNDPAGDKRRMDDKTFALDHFVVKLLTLECTMKTNAGRVAAQSLSKFLESYRNGLIEDQKTGNTTSGRFKVAHTYHNAGEKKIALFHSNDPFAENGRKLDSANYALDHLLRENDPYISQFLYQLRLEL